MRGGELGGVSCGWRTLKPDMRASGGARCTCNVVAIECLHPRRRFCVASCAISVPVELGRSSCMGPTWPAGALRPSLRRFVQQPTDVFCVAAAARSTQGCTRGHMLGPGRQVCRSSCGTDCVRRCPAERLDSSSSGTTQYSSWSASPAPRLV